VDPDTGRDACFPLEVNPRYTASVELLERAYRVELLDLHRCVFENRPVQPPAARASMVWAKGIVYARQDLVFPSDGPWLDALRQSPFAIDTEYADIPNPGERIQRGRPVLTVFASGRSSEQCICSLRCTMKALDQR